MTAGNDDELQQEAEQAGYKVEVFERNAVLLRTLTALRAHPFLAPRLALKGGTALNLFVLDGPRLSMDIDLNYVGATAREEMLAERPRVEQALQQVAGRLKMRLKRTATEHAGGKWRFGYDGPTGLPGNVEIDLNYTLRAPLWTPNFRDSGPISNQRARDILVLDVHELAAGKLAALCARHAPRDLFDARQLLRSGLLDEERLRLGFVVYGAANRTDFSDIDVAAINTTAQEVLQQLAPALRSDLRPDAKTVDAWTKQLIDETRALMSQLLPLRDHEREFLRAINTEGEIKPELLTDDARLQDVLRDHPALRWKAQNVRKHRGQAPSAERRGRTR